jgi:Mce-associated membrane protein
VVTGLMIVAHQKVTARQAHQAELVTAARQGVIALLSIDYNRAKADVQHVIDLSTGTFRDDFTRGADDFIKTAEQSKAVTVGTVKSAALEKENGDTGVVLLAASSTVSNSNGAQQDPRAWRMSVTVARDGAQYKMSNVEFVP